MDWYYILLIILGVYLLTWVILFIFPIWRKKNPIRIAHPDSEVILGAHRGGSLERLENSLAAFKHARECGMHILEMDVQLTKDKQVVVHHDNDLSRLVGIDRPFIELNYDEIPPVMQETKQHFGVNYYELKRDIDDGRIPLLKDVFRDNPNMPMNIDLKGGSEELMFEVYKMILEYQREDITYFGDMNEARNIRAQKMGADSGIRTFASIKYTILTCVTYFLGVLQFCPFRHYSFWYPFFSTEQLRVVCEILGNRWKHRCLCKLYRCFTWCMKPMFWHLRRRGVLVMFWNINTLEEYNRALTYSIDGILTDRPEEIRRIADLKRKGRKANNSDEFMASDSRQ